MWIGDVIPDGFPNNTGFRFEITDSCSITMTLKPQKSTQTQTDVINYLVTRAA